MRGQIGGLYRDREDRIPPKSGSTASLAETGSVPRQGRRRRCAVGPTRSEREGRSRAVSRREGGGTVPTRRTGPVARGCQWAVGEKGKRRCALGPGEESGPRGEKEGGEGK